MAEVVGVVASGISIGTLAAQVASSILKLKSLWNELRDAPDDIKDLIDEVEILNNILLDLDADVPSPVIGFEHQQSRMECLRHCRAASNKMSMLVDNLHADIEKSKGLRRKIVSAKLILRKDQVKKYKSRLKGTMRLLSLSEQCYTRAYQRHVHTILTQIFPTNCATRPLVQQEKEWTKLRVTHDSNNAEKEDNLLSFNTMPWQPPSQSPLEHLFGYMYYTSRVSTPTIWNELSELGANDKDENKSSYLRYRTPAWLANQIWEICNMKAHSTWTCNLRVYNVVPSDSLIFEFIRRDNIGAVQTLLSRRMASPFDRDDVKGWTALHLAASCGNFAICKLLLEAGADPNIPDFYLKTPFRELCSMAGALAFERGVSMTHLFRLFLSREADVLAEDKKGAAVLHKFRGPKEALKLLLRQATPSGFELPLRSRVKAAIYYLDCEWHNTPELVRMVLGPGPIEHAATSIEEVGTTIVHGVLQALARAITWDISPFAGGEKYYDTDYWEHPLAKGVTNSKWAKMRRDWTTLLEELLKAGADLHQINSSGRTPFLEAFDELIELSEEYLIRNMNDVFQHWLQDVRDAGVDLLQYGENEVRLHASGNCNRVSIPELGCYSEESGYEYRLIGFSYGPSPADWHLSVTKPTDIFAGDFWRSIEAEYQERTIPGGWID